MRVRRTGARTACDVLVLVLVAERAALHVAVRGEERAVQRGREPPAAVPARAARAVRAQAGARLAAVRLRPEPHQDPREAHAQVRATALPLPPHHSFTASSHRIRAPPPTSRAAPALL